MKELLPEKEANLLQENISDEQPEEGASHTETYLEFLNTLSSPETSFLDIDPSITKFIHSLRLLFKKNLVYHVSVLAGIEYFYITISNFFIDYLKPFIIGKQCHYVVHEELDKKHSDDLITISMNLNKQNDNKLIIEGLEYGFQLLNDLYYELSFVL